MVAVCKNAHVLSTMVCLLAPALVWDAKPRESVIKSNFGRWKMLEDKTSTYEQTALREWATQWRTHKSIDSHRMHVHWGECMQMHGAHTKWALGQLETCLRWNLRVLNAYNLCRNADVHLCVLRAFAFVCLDVHVVVTPFFGVLYCVVHLRRIFNSHWAHTKLPTISSPHFSIAKHNENDAVGF